MIKRMVNAVTKRFAACRAKSLQAVRGNVGLLEKNF